MAAPFSASLFQSKLPLRHPRWWAFFSSSSFTPLSGRSHHAPFPGPLRRASTRPPRARARTRVTEISDSQLRENWLSSLSWPVPSEANGAAAAAEEEFDGVGRACNGWMVGVDPDVAGAVALLKDDGSAQVFDTPYLQVLVGKRTRRRLNVRSITQMLRGLGAPAGTRAFIEQSIPFPRDGKQGWWCGGFTYGLWMGALVASGFSVVPVPSQTWKRYFFELSHGSSCKDESRRSAAALFPDLASLLTRKKDHGRAEALLIAAYGKRLTLPSEQNDPSIVQVTNEHFVGSA